MKMSIDAINLLLVYNNDKRYVPQKPKNKYGNKKNILIMLLFHNNHIEPKLQTSPLITTLGSSAIAYQTSILPIHKKKLYDDSNVVWSKYHVSQEYKYQLIKNRLRNIRTINNSHNMKYKYLSIFIIFYLYWLSKSSIFEENNNL